MHVFSGRYVLWCIVNCIRNTHLHCKFITIILRQMCYGYGVQRHFQQYYSYIVVVLEETEVLRKKHLPVVNQRRTLSYNVVRILITPFLYSNSSCIEYTSPWRGFELTTLVVIGIECIGSCKYEYHTIKLFRNFFILVLCGLF